MTWKGVIVDGHNRYDICQRHGLRFEVAEIVFADEGSAEVWIIRNQFGRRNLAPFTRGELAMKLEPLLKEEAKKRQGKRNDLIQNVAEAVKVGKLRPLTAGAVLEATIGSNFPPKLAESEGETREKLADASGLSHGTIAKVKLIATHADEEGGGGSGW